MGWPPTNQFNPRPQPGLISEHRDDRTFVFSFCLSPPAQPAAMTLGGVPGLLVSFLSFLSLCKRTFVSFPFPQGHLCSEMFIDHESWRQCRIWLSQLQGLLSSYLFVLQFALGLPSWPTRCSGFIPGSHTCKACALPLGITVPELVLKRLGINSSLRSSPRWALHPLSLSNSWARKNLAGYLETKRMQKEIQSRDYFYE